MVMPLAHSWPYPSSLKGLISTFQPLQGWLTETDGSLDKPGTVWISCVSSPATVCPPFKARIFLSLPILLWPPPSPQHCPFPVGTAVTLHTEGVRSVWQSSRKLFNSSLTLKSHLSNQTWLSSPQFFPSHAHNLEGSIPLPCPTQPALSGESSKLRV